MVGAIRYRVPNSDLLKNSFYCCFIVCGYGQRVVIGKYKENLWGNVSKEVFFKRNILKG